MAPRTAVLAGVAVSLLAWACSPGPEGDPAMVARDASPPPFVGRVWVATDESAAPGTLRIFLSDGALLMDSCWETYRLAEWRALGDGRIEWREDGARIEAEVIQTVPDQLRLRLHLTGGIVEQAYRLAGLPFVCPDLPR